MNDVRLLLAAPLMFLPPLFSHINQKTQFENPVMEAKKKLTAETPTGAPGPAAPPAGNSRSTRRHADDLCLSEKLQSFTTAETFLRTGGGEERETDLCFSFGADGPGCLVAELP